jgi:spore coat polysaccharide biosynthesis protein SpsF
MGSSRLPGKVLERAAGRTLLEHLVVRLRHARTLSDIVIATTRSPADDAIETEAARLGVRSFRGSEDDVLERFHEAALSSNADVIVRITADCPLLDPAEVDRVVQTFLEADSPLDYAANLSPKERRIPLGLSVEVLSRAALSRAHREGHEKYHREHVTPYLYEQEGRFRTRVVHPSEDLSHLRLTVDTREDLSVVREVLEAIEGQPDAMALGAALRFLAAHPDVAQRNVGVRQKGFEETDGEARLDGLFALFRADATPGTGAGHVMRCMAIAEAWTLEGGRAACLGAMPASIAERFEARGVDVLALPEGTQPGSPEDAALVVRTARERGARVVVLDGYAFDARYLAAARGAHVTAYVDDHEQQGLPVDVVIDPNAGARQGSRGGPRVLAGSAFTPLRAEIARTAPPERSFEGRAPSLLLAFGGSDPARLSARGLRAALAVSERAPLHVTVLAGPMHPDLDALTALSAAPGVSLVHDAREVGPLFAATDLALAAAGSTAWELAAMGVPMLLVQVADNQRAVIEPLVAGGVAKRLDREVAEQAAAFEAAIEQFIRTDPDELRRMSEAGRRVVDGRGAARIARTLGELAREKSQEPKEAP